MFNFRRSLTACAALAAICGILACTSHPAASAPGTTPGRPKLARQPFAGPAQQRDCPGVQLARSGKIRGERGRQKA